MAKGLHLKIETSKMEEFISDLSDILDKYGLPEEAESECVDLIANYWRVKFYNESSELRDLLQWCYNYTGKMSDGDERTALLVELKKAGCV